MKVVRLEENKEGKLEIVGVWEINEAEMPATLKELERQGYATAYPNTLYLPTYEESGEVEGNEKTQS